METFGSATNAISSLAAVAAHQPFARPVIRQPDLVNHAALDAQRPQALGHQHARFDLGPRGADRGPPAVLQAALRAPVPARLRRTSPAAAPKARTASGSCRPRCGVRSVDRSSPRYGNRGSLVGLVVRIVVALPFHALRIALLPIQRILRSPIPAARSASAAGRPASPPATIDPALAVRLA